MNPTKKEISDIPIGATHTITMGGVTYFVNADVEQTHRCAEMIDVEVLIDMGEWYADCGQWERDWDYPYKHPLRKNTHWVSCEVHRSSLVAA